jgi:DoxX-like family
VLLRATVEGLIAKDELEQRWVRLGAAAGRYDDGEQVQVAGAAGVLLGLALRPLGVAAASGLVLLSIGAIVTHRRAGDKAVAALPALMVLALAAATLVLQAA